METRLVEQRDGSMGKRRKEGVECRMKKDRKEDGRVEGRTYIDKERRKNRWKDGGTEGGRTSGSSGRRKDRDGREERIKTDVNTDRRREKNRKKDGMAEAEGRKLETAKWKKGRASLPVPCGSCPTLLWCQQGGCWRRLVPDVMLCDDLRGGCATGGSSKIVWTWFANVLTS